MKKKLLFARKVWYKIYANSVIKLLLPINQSNFMQTRLKDNQISHEKQ